MRQVQARSTALAERCGNANLVSIIPTLMLKAAFRPPLSSCRWPRERAWPASRGSAAAFDELINRPPDHQAPYVGASALATKAGIHAPALIKEPQTYEHVPPETVGNQRKVMGSDQGGKSNFIAELKRRGITVEQSDPRLDTLISKVKEREAQAMPMRARMRVSRCWRGARSAGARFLQGRELPLHGRASVRRHGVAENRIGGHRKVTVDGEERMSVAEGHGPINALDIARARIWASSRAEIDDLETGRLQGAHPQWRHRGDSPVC